MSFLQSTGKYVSSTSLERGAAVLAMRHAPRSANPSLRKDLTVRRQVNMGVVTWVIRNPETLKVYGFEESMWELISLFDGEKSRADIQAEYNRTHPKTPVELSVVLDFEDQLRKMELVEQSVAERNLALIDKLRNARKRAAEERAAGFNIFFISWKVLDPDKLLNRMLPWVGWLWSPPVVIVASAFFAMAAYVFVTNWSSLLQHTLQLYALASRPWSDILQFYLIITALACLHEFSHGMVVKKYGGEVHDIGFALWYFTPAFYCDTTDSYLFENRWQRLWVYTAGIYTESIVCVMATGLWLAAYPDTLLHEIAYKTMLYTGIGTAFFNSNPLVKSDGYHVVAHVLDLPGLREDSFAFLGAWVQRKILRLNVEVPVHSKRRRRIFTVYGLLSLAYTATVMILIGHLFYYIYEKFFPDFAVPLLVVTLYVIFKKRAMALVNILRMVYLDKKELFMSPRVRVPLAVAAAVAVLALVMPWRRSIDTPIQLLPVTSARVDAPEAGLVASVAVGEGDLVRPGQVVATLSNAWLEAEVSTLAVARERLAAEKSRLLAKGDAKGAFQAQSELDSAVSALETARTRHQRLEVTSPAGGRVLTARPQDLVGRVVRSGEPLLQVGDTRRLSAEIPITERLLSWLTPGETVSAQLTAWPTRTIAGRVVSISPASLAKKREVGPEEMRPSEIPGQFVAVAQFDNSSGTLVPGMAGVAKVYSGRSPYVVRAWQVVYRWARTIVW